MSEPAATARQSAEPFPATPRVVSLGVGLFAEQLAAQGVPVIQVDWRPPAGGDPHLATLLDRLDARLGDRIDAANARALERLFAAQPRLVGIKYRHKVWPDLDRHVLLHAGPPITWERMCGPLRGAVVGALRYEGLAADEAAALALVESGRVRFAPNHDFATVGPMTGITSYSMPLFEVVDAAHGTRAYCAVNEGLGKVMRFGANDDSVIARLRWLEQVLAPTLRAVLAAGPPLDLRVLMAQALAMGDEMHQRNVAATSLLARALLPRLVRAAEPAGRVAEVADFLVSNDQFFLNLAMAAGKASLDAIRDIECCTLVAAMCRNGTDFAIRVSGLGDTWFTAPAEQPRGLYFAGYSEADANPDMGDSAIVECLGVGGFCMAAAPAVVRFVGAGSVERGAAITEEMAEITAGRSPHLLIPALGFAGAPSGIDVRKVVATGIRPLINTGIAHRQAGVGQVGAGVVRAPADCFRAALEAFVGRYLGEQE